MKWIGQHIYDNISRFRDDVYLEDLSTTTETSVLVVDSDGKVSKSTSITGDITSVVAGVGLSGGATSGAATLTVDFSEFSTVTPTSGDFLATLDSDGATEQKTTTDALATLFAGSGLTASSGVIGVDTLNQDTTGEAGTVATIAGLAPNTATTQATQAAITTCANLTTIGSITTGSWRGSVIASGYLDADTAHYSAQKQLTYYFMQDDIDTTKIYIALQEADAESATATNKNLPILAPVAGKLLKVFLRTNTDLSGKTLTWRLETQNTSSNTAATPTIVGTQSGAGSTNQTMTTYDFTSSLDSGDNIIDAGDTVQLSVQSDGTTANTKFYITCLWEWNLS